MSFRTDAARQLLEGWSMNVNAEPARIAGRVLPAETIEGQKERVSSSSYFFMSIFTVQYWVMGIYKVQLE